jgi:hypothetical protein
MTPAKLPVVFVVFISHSSPCDSSLCQQHFCLVLWFDGGHAGSIPDEVIDF